MTREQKITTISLIILVGFTVAAFYHYVVGTYLNLDYPFNTFLFSPEDRWTDFVRPYLYSRNPYAMISPNRIYFPLLYELVSLFRSTRPVASLFSFLFLTWSSFALICLHELRTENRAFNLQVAFIFSFLSYPILITLDRANLEIIEFIFLYFFIFYYHKQPNLSAILLGCAIALKGFPVVMAVLLLADRKVRQLLIAALTSLSLTIISYAALPGGFWANITAHLLILSRYTQIYALGDRGLAFGNSLWGALKLISILANSYMIDSSAYTMLALAMLIMLSYYIIFREKDFWKRTALTVCAFNLLPMVSGDYKLLHLFIPLFLFIRTSQNQKYDWAYAVLFGLLLIPKNYYHLPTLPEASIAILLNPVLMLCLVLLIVMEKVVLKLLPKTQ